MSKFARIAPLANLPLFHKLDGKLVVVAGTSTASAWKAELLAATGADVRRVGTDWSETDLEGAVLAVADLGDRSQARRFVDAAHAAGSLVSIVDAADLSDVTFGTIVNRSPAVIGISTDGAAPMLGQAIRGKIEAVLPRNLSAWASAAKDWRPHVRQKLAQFSERRAFWQRFVTAVFAGNERAPTEADFHGLLAGDPGPQGRVTLVGAGPGDPDLLTLRAVQALQSATVILYDQLVGPHVLELARREARRIPVGKSAYAPSCKQDDINALMVELALAGEQVVRLKGGDPLIFGRAGEEIAACRAAGVAVNVVPGISAAQGAAASLLVSLTERRLAQRVQFVTCHGADAKLPNDIHWPSVADRKTTTVLYMPRKTLDQFVQKALRNGLDPATPAIAIASTTLPEESHVASNVAEIGALAAGLAAGAPVTVLIGWVCRHHVARSSVPLRFPTALAS